MLHDSVGNFIVFQRWIEFKNCAKFDEITANYKVGSFLRHSVYYVAVNMSSHIKAVVCKHTAYLV